MLVPHACLVTVTRLFTVHFASPVVLILERRQATCWLQVTCHQNNRYSVRALYETPKQKH
jgi:hypothetical protein